MIPRFQKGWVGTAQLGEGARGWGLPEALSCLPLGDELLRGKEHEREMGGGGEIDN